jgi:hypothetical protein
MKQTSHTCIILLKHLYHQWIYDTSVSLSCQGGYHEESHDICFDFAGRHLHPVYSRIFLHQVQAAERRWEQ